MPQPAATAPAPSIAELRGVGPKTAQKLARLGIHTVADLLFHLPYRYQDRTRVQPMGSLRPGQEAVVQGEILLAQIRPGRRRALLVRIADGSGQLGLRFFHFSRAQQQAFVRGHTIRCFGEARPGPQGLEMVHPHYRIAPAEALPPLEAHLTPLYPSSEGLSQALWLRLSEQALEQLERDPALAPEWLPGELLQRHRLPDLHQALWQLHRPAPDQNPHALRDGRHPAQQRLALEELLAHRLSLRRFRQRARARPAFALAAPGELARRLCLRLPFELTPAQQRVSEEIRRDLAQATPMLRLVQGDVGSGKTVVAALAALQAVEAGYQAALMAPTELLAEQHLRNLSQWLDGLGVRVGLISGKLKGRARQQTLQALREQALDIAVGTHALFQDGVDFARLGLVIIDEQHRFGVHQRLALWQKGAERDHLPHQLVMTATPIPRTLAMTAYADLDISVIDQLPAGRQTIDTVVLPERRRAEVVERVRQAALAGRQVYWVCPLIEESELLDAQAAEKTAAELAQALPELRVGLIHGRMKSAEKDALMSRFKQGDIDVLVATTVIEVGVDVPRASLMIIENAERLGLAQLHQLRGRVGRGREKSTCVLLYHGGLSAVSRQRLAIMRETNDGFRIAQRDLELRGPGELLGTRQTGLPGLRVADLSRDQHLLPLAEEAAELLFARYPDNIAPLIRRWLPQGLRYGEV